MSLAMTSRKPWWLIERAALNNVALLAFFWLALHYAYKYGISPAFSYFGCTYDPYVSPFSFIPAFLFSAIPLFFMRLGGSRPSNFVTSLLFSLVYVPTQYVLTVIDMPIEQPLFLRVVMLAGLFSIIFFSRTPREFAIKRRLSLRVFHWIIGLIFASLLLIVFSKFGLRFHLPSLTDVYDVRSDYQESVSDGLVGYAVPLLGVVSCFMVGYGYIRRNYLWMLTGLPTLLYLFGVTGQKTTLFSSLFALSVIWMYGKDPRKMTQRMLLSVTVVVVAAFAYDGLFDSINGSSFFTRRVIITPGLLTVFYYDFFSRHDMVHLAHSVLSPFFTYPYALTPPYLIGAEYFQNPEMSANANMLADGYANFGAFGVVGFGALLGVILSFLDGFARKRSGNALMLSMTVALPAFALTNGALLTVMLTHGFVLALLIAGLYSITADSPDPDAA